MRNEFLLSLLYSWPTLVLWFRKATYIRTAVLWEWQPFFSKVFKPDGLPYFSVLFIRRNPGCFYYRKCVRTYFQLLARLQNWFLYVEVFLCEMKYGWSCGCRDRNWTRFCRNTRTTQTQNTFISRILFRIFRVNNLEYIHF